jgi:uncharacterized repeat protein (TIGR03803 family)
MAGHYRELDRTLSLDSAFHYGFGSKTMNCNHALARITKTIFPILVALFFVATRVEGKSFVHLYEFNGISDGAAPCASLISDGTWLYGTASSGGTNDSGTVFKLKLDGTSFTVLKTFDAPSGYPDYTNSTGYSPEAALVLSGSLLFGTTHWGGAENAGTVFRLLTDGSAFKVLKHFPRLSDPNGSGTNSDGACPVAPLTLLGGTLFGTASKGGSAGNGTIFKLFIDGAGFSVMKAFAPCPMGPYYTNTDGAAPYAPLTFYGGLLYGTTSTYGPRGAGCIYKIGTNGAGFELIKSFSSWDAYPSTNADGSSGSSPQGALAISNGTIYGTTFLGGSADNSGSGLVGSGVVFKVNTDGTGFAVLKYFPDGDGWEPFGVILSKQTLYGITYQGGNEDAGVAYSLNTDGTMYTRLRSFSSSNWPPEAVHPSAPPLLLGGYLYGPSEGGGFQVGTIFRLKPAIPLSVNRTANGTIVKWSDPTFLLQASMNATGPFTNVVNATSPYTNNTTTGELYYRLFSD